jgi:hypothetical protein
MWGIFDFRLENGVVHAAPINPDGSILKPHTFTEDCICEPEIEFFPESGFWSITHHGPDNYL